MNKKKTGRNFSSTYKAKVAPEAVKGQLTLTEPAKKFDVSQVIISRWKLDFSENKSAAFEKTESRKWKMWIHRNCMLRSGS